ncbi:MAG: hypothetical protein JTT12_05610 [Candidatus Brockarchaeota archaeon]|nr:hypothetical protein [Candidatus Brockarchaeota archaeon]
MYLLIYSVKGTNRSATYSFRVLRMYKTPEGIGELRPIIKGVYAADDLDTIEYYRAVLVNKGAKVYVYEAKEVDMEEYLKSKYSLPKNIPQTENVLLNNTSQPGDAILNNTSQTTSVLPSKTYHTETPSSESSETTPPSDKPDSYQDS